MQPEDSRETPTVAAEAKAVEENVRSSWDALRASEVDAITQRRKVAYPEDENLQAKLPRVGLALSGGGIRSATFCFGLIRGLAQNGILRRFDYLSTVSGGGYAGSVLGRLVQSLGIGKAQETLAAGDSMVLTWLRRNGRYLTPAGARDFGMLIATYLRAAVAVHLEIAFIALLAGLLLIAPRVLLPGWFALDEQSWQPWQTFWWPLAAMVWLTVAPGLMTAYWNVRGKIGVTSNAAVADGFSWRPSVLLLTVTVVTMIFSAWASRGYLYGPTVRALPPFWLAIAAITFGVSGTLAWLLVSAQRATGKLSGFIAGKRNALTRALRFINKLVFAMFCLGALELATRKVLEVDATGWLTGSVGAGTIIVLLMRSFAEPLQKLANAPDGAAARWLPRLINLAGLGLGLVVVAGWVTLLQWLVFDERAWHALDFLSPIQRWIFILIAVALWVFGTAANRDTVNASSLHSFYRARLIRAYLSVGNRLGDAGMASMTSAEDTLSSVTRVEARDDIALSDYCPEAFGGPIHLVCACINQTIDDRSDLFNADRKGAAVVASSRAIEVGLGAPELAGPDRYFNTLGHWVATSGAAAAPGAGSNTTSGWALLLFMVGARLGYWLDSMQVTESKVRARPLGESKSGLLWTEALAWFGGKARRWWYLSDGGHFDNTGVYALLRRELDCIVLADCGADAKFEFADIENLVRKARIDFDADIEFYTPHEAAELFPGRDTQLQVLAPEQMADNQSVRGVLLARICYHRSDAARRKFGSLLVVKPNLFDSLDRDLLAYASRNPTFPQQATGDQFFDEAQWESYHRLGEVFGRAMTRTWMNLVPGWRVAIEPPGEVVPLRSATADGASVKADVMPFWRRGVTATALGAGLGLGAIGTVLLSSWQVVDSFQTRQQESAKRDQSAREQAVALADSLAVRVFDLTAIATNCDPTVTSSTSSSGVPACAPRFRDLGISESLKLRQVREATRTYVGDATLKAAAGMVAEAQAACGTTNGVCSDGAPIFPNFCQATCDRPKASVRYWSTIDSTPDWTLNPVAQSFTQLIALVGLNGDAATANHDMLVDTAQPQMDQSTSPAPSIASPSESEIVPTSLEVERTGADSEPVAADVPAEPAEPVDDPVATSLPIPEMAPAPRRLRAGVPLPEVRSPMDWSICQDNGKAMAVYVQIYDESLRGRLEELGRGVLGGSSKNANLWMAGIENVVATAALRDEKPPNLHRSPTLIVHRGDDVRDMACASQISERLQPIFNTYYANEKDAHISIRKLPASLQSRRHVIELWLPPATAAVAD